MMPDKALIVKPITQPTEILAQLRSGQLLRVRGHRGSALIICHRHYAELVGPGSAVGGVFDIDCGRVIPIGRLALVYPQVRAERVKAYTIRQQWISYIQKATASLVPLQRAITLLTLLERYLGHEILERLPDELLAQLVGVLPKTVRMGRTAIHSRRERQTPQSVQVRT